MIKREIDSVSDSKWLSSKMDVHKVCGTHTQVSHKYESAVVFILPTAEVVERVVPKKCGGW